MENVKEVSKKNRTFRFLHRKLAEKKCKYYHSTLLIWMVSEQIVEKR